ncbi:hypothetical protein KP13_04435 [Klebsiella pneumoniae subsp. pneumoniae Kp13]|nr:hypothetical protein KP13_04435 [Klebsiella pneumoniae subsp. pneumoniae Kp13]
MHHINQWPFTAGKKPAQLHRRIGYYYQQKNQPMNPNLQAGIFIAHGISFMESMMLPT